MLGKREPRSSISSLVMIAADLGAKPGILIASGGEERKAEELLPVVQRPLSNTGGYALAQQPSAHRRGRGGAFSKLLPEQGRDRWTSGSHTGMQEGMEGAPSQPQKELKVKP